MTQQNSTAAVHSPHAQLAYLHNKHCALHLTLFDAYTLSAFMPSTPPHKHPHDLLPFCNLLGNMWSLVGVLYLLSDWEATYHSCLLCTNGATLCVSAHKPVPHMGRGAALCAQSFTLYSPEEHTVISSQSAKSFPRNNTVCRFLLRSSPVLKPCTLNAEQVRDYCATCWVSLL